MDAANAAADAMLALLVGDSNSPDCASTRMITEISVWQESLGKNIDSWNDTAKGQITALQGFLSHGTLTTLKAENPGPSATAGPVTCPVQVGGSPLQPLADVVHDVKANWLRDKVKNQPVRGSPDNTAVNAAFRTFTQPLLDALGTVGVDVKLVADAVYDAVKGGRNPSEIKPIRAFRGSAGVRRGGHAGG